jgi:hypothetical protein
MILRATSEPTTLNPKHILQQDIYYAKPCSAKLIHTSMDGEVTSC